MIFFLSLTILSLIIWIYLLLFRGQFWRASQRLPALTAEVPSPKVSIIIPARNEADILPITLKSLLEQNYSGELCLILVDDNSNDGTAQIAQTIAKELNKEDRLKIISGQPLPKRWTGKLWAMQQGFKALSDDYEYILLTDADIQHDPDNLQQLVEKAQKDDLALVSLMVSLRCQSAWEKLLIPAFVFFFAKLYPFAWVNDPTNPTAAAAGGCILIRYDILKSIGGLEILKEALIDDCTLAQVVKKNSSNSKIWLGLSQTTSSLRPYDSLESIWSMVSRTAFTQLNYSGFLLLGTLLGMVIVYLVPIISLLLGIFTSNLILIILGALTYTLLSLAYLPTILLYRLSPLRALSLPIVALFYTLMTFDSAWQHWQGSGGAWKGRVYSDKV